MKRKQVFEELEPPPFGLERLKARMTERRRRMSPLVLVGVMASALVVLLAWPKTPGVDLVALARASSAAPMVGVSSLDDVTALEQTGVLRMPSQNPDVVLYRVASLQQEPSAPPRD
jgi:hypothetical protein